MQKQTQRNKPLNFKVIVVGDQSVGKTHIIHQYVQGQVPVDAQATIGVDFQMKTVIFPKRNETIKLNIFDTAGEEKYHAVTACHYRKAKGAVIVYDVTSRKSFEHVDKWLQDVQQLADHDCSIVVIGNKNDIDQRKINVQTNNGQKGSISKTQQREVPTAEGIEFAKRNQVSFFEVSAFQHESISKAFNTMAERILNQYQLEQIQRDLSSAETNRGGKNVQLKRGRFECCVSGGRDGSQQEETRGGCC
eukprot:403358325